MTRLVLLAAPVFGAGRISSNLPEVNSLADEEAHSARSRLFGVMMTSGLTNFRFICRRSR